MSSFQFAYGKLGNPYKVKIVFMLVIYINSCHYLRGHWRLLIFCHFGESIESNTNPPCMLLLDSLIKAGADAIVADIHR